METRFVELYDVHVGNELTSTRDGWKLLPAHDEGLIKRTLKFVNDFKPDVVILGGDQLNFDDISDYTKNYKIDKAPGTIRKAFEDFDRLLGVPLTKLGCKIWWMEGNHEARLEKFIAKFPALEGLVDIRTNLPNLDVFYGRGEIAKLGKLHFVHGDTILGSRGKHPASSLMSRYHCNIHCGHFHKYDIAVENSWADTKDVKMAVSMPCMRNRRPGFLHGSPNAHVQGFGYGFVTSKGNFNSYVVIDTGSFTVNGKVYA